MEAGPGALQRAGLVAVPLALVVLIMVTPVLLGRHGPEATDIPLLWIGVTGERWNATVNETGLLYVKSALGLPLYDAIEIRVTGPDAPPMANATHVPSLAHKIPVFDRWIGNVSAAAKEDSTLFVYNATVEFRWGDPDWTIRVMPEDATGWFEVNAPFSASLRRVSP